MPEQKNVQVCLNLLTEIKEFQILCNQQPFGISLKSGRFVADAKSQLGLFSLDLTTPNEVIITDSEGYEDAVDEFLKAIDKWTVK